jgi:hypothetical protein
LCSFLLSVLNAIAKILMFLAEIMADYSHPT